MNVIKIAVPVIHGRRKFHFDKGRPWSIIEHVLLFTLSRNRSTASELALKGDIPQRVVIEGLIRLMRAGWVEMLYEGESVFFEATMNGSVAAKKDELPNASQRLSRKMNFVIDQITGTIYRSRELPFYHEYALVEREKNERIIRIERPSHVLMDEVSPLVEALFLDDEKFVSVDPSGERLSERWSLITVRDGEIEGLSKRAPTLLKESIKKAAESAPEKIKAPHAVPLPPHGAQFNNSHNLPIERQLSFSTQDLILGGADHREALYSTIRRARHRVLIHSTFISESRFNEILPELRASADRGVRIDIMWGQNDNTDDSGSTRHVISRINANIKEIGIDMIRVHPFSTNSHCKVLLADTGSSNSFTVVVGSCNWLLSNFDSFEASVRLRQPKIVADVVGQIAELSKGTNGIWTKFTNELAALGANIRSQPETRNQPHTAQIILGSSHADLIRQARDESKNRIFVTSHRFGIAGKPSVIAPTLTAAIARGINVQIYYGTTSGPLKGSDAAEITSEVGRKGVVIRPIRKPRLHAKLLAWDDETIIVTSQNWLSADPPDYDPRQEIGVRITAPNLARKLIERFEMAKIE